MPTVVVAHPASQGLLGQGEYQRQLIRELLDVESVMARSLPVQPMRGRLDARRLPLGLLAGQSVARQRRLSRLAYGRADLVHRMDAGLPVAADEVLTLHDLAPLEFDDEGSWPATATPSARLARAVVAPSRFAADEISAKLQVPGVRAIHNGVDPACYGAGPLTDADRRDLGRLPGRCVVYVGGSSRRKNLPALAAAWRRVHGSGEDAGLLICGPLSEEKGRLFGDLPGCRLLGPLDRGLLLRLISTASAVVTPSLYEGFGLPVLEAMAAGTVVVSARTSALVEVGGDAALFTDTTAEGLAAGLQRALSEDHTRRIEVGRAWSRRFTWRAAARAHAELYCELAG